MAWPISVVLAEPPRSGVRGPDTSTCSMARTMASCAARQAPWPWPRKSSINAPDQIIATWRKRVAMTGALRPAMAVSYAGMPYDLVQGSLKLIASKVAPEVRKLAN